MAIKDYLDPLLRRPLLCLTLLWAAGIFIASRVALPWWWAAFSALFTITWAIIPRRFHATKVLSLSVAFLSLAAFVTAKHMAPITADDSRYLPAGVVTCIGYPLTMADRNDDRWDVEFKLVAIKSQGNWRVARGTVYLFGKAEVPAPGSHYRIIGYTQTDGGPDNPFGMSWPSYLAERVMTYRVRALKISSLPEPAPASPFIAARARMIDRLEATMPLGYQAVQTQLFESLLFGVHGSPIPPELSEMFRRAGTIHLMVVSGGQVTLLGSLFLFPLLLLRYGRTHSTYPRARVMLVALSLLILIPYVFLADRGPSVDRAVIMMLLSALCIVLAVSPAARERIFKLDMLTLLAAAALIMLVCRPALLFSAGMQLSFAAVFGLITITPIFARLFHPYLRACSIIPAATLGAQIMTVPVLAWHFGAISIISPVSNLIAVPLVGILLPLGLLTIAFASFAPPVAVMLNHINVPLLNALIEANRFFASLPFAEISWYVRNPLIIILYLVVVTAILRKLSQLADTVAKDWTVQAGREPLTW